MPEFFEKSPLSGVRKHPDFQVAPAHSYLPKLLITIFGHTPYLPQGDTMFLGHPILSGKDP